MTIEVLLKDTGETIRMTSNETIASGQTSNVFTGKVPTSGNLDDVEVLNTIRDILKNSDVEGAASITQYNYISIKILGYSSDKLIQVSDKISEYLMNLEVN